MADKIFKYESDEITVTYNVDRCIHYSACVRGLPDVFDPKRKPWVDPEMASADSIALAVRRCPTGALHFRRKDGGAQEEAETANRVTVSRNGPLYVRGDIVVKTKEGEVIVEDTRMALCRCGSSNNKPFCDGSHGSIDFKDEGALGEGGVREVDSEEEDDGRLTIVANPNGSLSFKGPFTLVSADGTETKSGNRSAICRCGQSANKPICDRTHREFGFVG